MGATDTIAQQFVFNEESRDEAEDFLQDFPWRPAAFDAATWRHRLPVSPAGLRLERRRRIARGFRIPGNLLDCAGRWLAIASGGYP